MLYGKLLGVAPCMDKAYYVGFSVGDQEVGLDPHSHRQGLRGLVGYWHVDDIEESFSSSSTLTQKHGKQSSMLVGAS